MNFDKINLDNVNYIYSISNTPYFFYKNMRRDNEIELLSNKYSTDELISEFSIRSEKKINTLRELLVLYTISIALTFKEYNETSGFFEKLKKIDYEWFSEIGDIYISNYKNINIQNIILPNATVFTNFINDTNTITFNVLPKDLSTDELKTNFNNLR